MEKRNLSLNGKLCVRKTFLLSQFVYPMLALALPETVLNKFNSVVFKFLWQKKYYNKKAFEKVKRTVIYGEIEAGG